MPHPTRLTLRPLPARLALPCLERHRAFVSRFAAAAAGRTRAWPLSPVLLRRRATVLHAAGARWFAPSWTWVLSPRPAAPPASVRTLVRAGTALRPGVTTLRPAVATPAMRVLTVMRSHTHLERSATRHERHTSVPSVHVLRTMRIERHAAYPRVSVVLSRPPAPAPAPGVAERAATALPPAAHSPFAAARSLAWPAGREPLPPQELARVTDHVLAQLDRKVLSYRERHGQL
ncbi:hypothetical protein M8A51_13200 [Schlegelella sp. S2-27]|uniref:Uncharacterized protein n=1 Tax=Caldimonas mangrovi TaxID=2944811 RepID=A0ABT0YP27_9BURK|nr:hypothetical protein [Caldimonas mangrovi]MCM5680485.1 hypothetical protein [Caldimonas mangrovi]